MTEQTILNENVSENDVNLRKSANGRKKISWPEMRIFIEMDSVCRNQQGNCDEVENSARPFFVIFLALWLNLCNNSDQTLIPRPRFSTSPSGPGKR